MLIDTHVHLSDTRFDIDRREAIKRANDKGVKHLIEIGCEPRRWKDSLNIALTNPGISCALGIHPQDAKTATEQTFLELENLACQKEVVGIGETGLDYFHLYSPKDAQKEVFLKHISLAKKTGKPLVIHCREAYSDMMEIFKSIDLSGLKGVVHCFSGTFEQALEIINFGFFIGIDGPVSYPSAKLLKETAAKIPLEKIILETDSPYLPPQNFRGERNEPSYVYYVAEELAKIKNIDFETVSKITTQNAVNLFKL